MLIHDAQEQVRLLYAALGNRSQGAASTPERHLTEAQEVLKQLTSRSGRAEPTSESNRRSVGILLLAAFGIASHLEVDSLDALKSVLLEESP